MDFRKIAVLLLGFGVFLSGGWAPAGAEEPVALRYDQDALEQKWRGRIQSLLDKGVIALVDLESSIGRRDGERYIEDSLEAMDELGIALIAFDAKQADKGEKKQKGYRWSYYSQELVNAHPERFVPTSNGGANMNWTQQKDSYIDQLEEQVRGGEYRMIGEIEFRHYMSNQQCKQGRTDRDVDIPLNGGNGQRIFALSQDSGIPFSIHLEPEDEPLAALEEMLREYPKANVIVAHFGQIRHPDKESQFGPELVRRLLSSYPNLYWDISTGEPGRRYKCNDVLDTVIWKDGGFGQKDELKGEYKAILTEFSDRFVVGFDYGGGRDPLPMFLKDRAKNARLILRDLP